jgi:hypothetical protein
VNDALSGPSGFRLVSAARSWGRLPSPPKTSRTTSRGFELGIADASGQLRAEAAGAASRAYTLEYESADRAGNGEQQARER